MRESMIKRVSLSALFLALGVVLPFFTAQIKEIGDTLLPMHLVVMLCGLLCGYGYGAIVGAALPFIRAISFGMPPLYPNAVWMSLELAAYGFMIGFLYSRFSEKKLRFLYLSLVTSMLCGRIVWGVSKAILFGVAGKAFTVAMFIAEGIADALPGIVLQLIIIPVIVKITEKIRKQ